VLEVAKLARSLEIERPTCGDSKAVSNAFGGERFVTGVVEVAERGQGRISLSVPIEEKEKRRKTHPRKVVLSTGSPRRRPSSVCFE
jgi:hypothetical protein